MPTRPIALLAALALLVAACGGDSTDEATTADDTATTAAGDEVETDSTDAPGTTEAPSTETTEAEGATAGEGVAGERTTVGEIALRADATESSRFEGTVTVAAGPEMPEPAEMTLTGAVDPASDSARIELDLSDLATAALGAEGAEGLPEGMAGLFDEPLEVITIGDTSWMRWPFLGLLTGAETEWVELPPEEAGSVTSSFGVGDEITSPTAFLDQLRDAEAEVTELGTEEVRGVETTRYRLLVDLAALSADVTEEERAELEEGIGGLERTDVPIEIWVGEDGRLYRYSMELDAATQGGAPGAAAVRFEFFDHGADVEITPPPADQVTPLEDLGGSLGGLGG